ncbi:MAG: aldehyde dehydrogenase [Bacteroidales bacterium]
MYQTLFIDDLSRLGKLIETHLSEEKERGFFLETSLKAYRLNNLFTPILQREALFAICSNYLQRDPLLRWLAPYSHLIREREEQVLIVMAGNLPLVGFHDLLSVLAAGYRAVVKLSTKDSVLLPAILSLLGEIRDYWRGRVQFVEELLPSHTIVIATGGDSSANYFNTLFSGKRRVIRGSRSSAALLRGDEGEKEIEGLSKDLSLYHGMGCRSVSLLLLPTGYRVEQLVQRLGIYASKWLESDTYFNNYRYQKALLGMRGIQFIDSGNMLFVESSSLALPISVVAIGYWNEIEEIDRFIEREEDKLQAIINYRFRGEEIDFGESQTPSLWSWADGIDILEFLLKFD